MSDLQTVIVRDLTKEACNIVSIELVPTEGSHFPHFEPGAHIDVHLPNGIVRSYSLMNSASQEKDVYKLGVLLDPNTKGGSAFLHNKLRVGQELQVSLPRNNFVLQQGNHSTVLVAGGIGITPIYSMLVHLLTLGNPVELIYCARNREEAAFIKTLEALNVKITWHFDNEKEGIPNLSDYLKGFDKDTHFYCCGPNSMLDSFQAICQQLGYTNSHVEYFSGVEVDDIASQHDYVVELAHSGLTLDVPAGSNLLDVIENAGVLVNTACRQGVCGACETDVLEGIPDHHDNVLSPRQKASNKMMMVCVSGCKGKKLVLDL